MPVHHPIRFITTPAFGEVKEHVRAELLAVALTRRLGHPVTIETASTYDEVIEALEKGEVDAAWGTAELCDRFEGQSRAVLRAVRSGSSSYHAAFICRADEPLTLDRLEGTSAAWVARWSTAGYLLPRVHLEEHGVLPDSTFSEQRLHGSYRRALLAVLSGEADVASIYCSQADERAVRAALTEHVGRREGELVPFAFTRATPSDGIIITSRLEESLADRLIDALVGLGAGRSGLLPHLGLFDTEGFAVDGHVVPAKPPGEARGAITLLMLEVTPDGACERAWCQSGRINGRACADVSGLPLSRVLDPSLANPICTLVSEAFRNRSGGRVQFHVGDEENARWYSAEITLSEASAEASAAVIVRDVTDSRAIEEELFHLASFPLLNPDPVLEIDRDGELLYANRAAHQHFPGMVAQGADHPIIAAMLAVNRSGHRERRAVLREVELDGRIWKISVLSPVGADFIRAAVVDVTESGSRGVRRDSLRLLPRS